MSSTRKTQRDQILAKLIAARSREVALPEIVACAAQYQSRLFELRQLGFRIPAPRVETIDGQRHTWYRLELDSCRAETSTNKPPKRQDIPETFFGDIARDRTYAE